MRNKRGIAIAAAGALLLSLTGNQAFFASDVQIVEETENTAAAAVSTPEDGITESNDDATAAAAQEETVTEAVEDAAAAAGVSEETEAEQAAASAKPLNPADEGITAQDAITGGRTLYSQMKHYADINDNEDFAALFESSTDAQTVQNQLQAVKSSLTQLDGLDSHFDLCFFDPTEDTTQSPYYFAVALCDYDVDDDGAVSWYSTLMRTAEYEDGWKISLMSPESLLKQQYPESYLDAVQDGRNAYDLYPSFAMRFTEGAVFDGALYSLPNLVWQEEDGSLSCAVWVANGTETSKWCETTDLVIKDDELGTVASVNVPVQQALAAGESALVTCTIPEDYVNTGTGEWTEISINSNLRYQ